MFMTITPEFIASEIARGKTYYLVLLMLGPTKRVDASLLSELQSRHLEHMFSLRQEGTLVLNGPSLLDSNFRGICIFHAPSLEEVRRHVDADPLVQAGFLNAEIHPWMGLPGDALP